MKVNIIIPDENGVSELIGVILLISLAIVGVSMIAVVFFSGESQIAIPQVETLVGDDPLLNKFYIFHNGGDSLNSGDYKVLIDLGSGYTDKTSEFFLEGGGTEWSAGESLVYDYSANGIKPVSASLIYIGKGQESLLSSTPLLYSGEGSLSGVTGDPGTGIIYNIDEDIVVNPVVIDDSQLINGNFLVKMNNEIAANINESEGFIADTVHYVIYNYDDVNRNPFVGVMAKNQTISGLFEATLVKNSLNAMSSGSMPFNITLTIIAYNNTNEDMIYSTSGKFIAVH